MKPKKAYFRYGIDKDHSDALYYELQDLKKNGESRWYFVAAEFVIDKVLKKDNGITLYWIRRPRQRRSESVILQSDWNGIQYLHIR